MRNSFLFFAILTLLIASCQYKTKPDIPDEEVWEVDTIPKATAICWIDKTCSTDKKLPVVRTAKAHIFLHPYGRIELKSFFLLRKYDKK